MCSPSAKVVRSLSSVRNPTPSAYLIPNLLSIGMSFFSPSPLVAEMVAFRKAMMPSMLVGTGDVNVCVHNTLANACRYDELQKVQNRLERELINEFN